MSAGNWALSRADDLRVQIDRLEAQLVKPLCYFGLDCGPFAIRSVALGAAFGALDTYFSRFLGYEVVFRGQPAFWHQMAFHVLVFGFLGLLAGRTFDRKKQLQQAFGIINRQYDDLKSNQKQLIQSEKLAVIGSLSASIAHEIRNPLGIMRSSAGLVADDLPADHPNQKPLEFIRDEIDRVSGLIEGMLVFAKPKEPVLAQARVNQLLDRALEFLKPELRKRKIEVVRQYSTELPEALVDSDQIHQVFLGLVINAMQAIRERGSITVITERLGDSLRIALHDSGGGIPAEHLEKIFEPFFTTKSEGTGLGLAVAKQIIDGHGGRIAARNEADRGATISIELPLHAMALAA